MLDHDCKAYHSPDALPRSLLRQLMSYVVFHISRRFPQYTGWLPAHTPRKAPLPIPAPGAASTIR